MRILHLLAPAPFGGLERVVQSLAVEQARAGHDVHVAAILDPGVTDHPILIALAARGVHTHPVRAGARAYGRERSFIRDLCTVLLPDIVHTHGYRTDVLHGPVARGLGIATVATAHGFIGGDWKNRLYEYLQRRAFRRCSAAVAVSRPMRDGLIAWGIPATRVHWIPNAWADPIPFLDRADARRELGIADDEWCAGFIGRIGHEKGPDTFVEAMVQVVRGRTDSVRGGAEGSVAGNVTAMLIGAGRMRDDLIERTRVLGMTDDIRFPGAIDNAGRFIRAFDVLVLSSRTEGTPMVLLEAMAAGVPVITTHVGGIPDVVSENEAILIPPNDPDVLAAALRAVRSEADASAVRAVRASERLHTELGAALWRERYDKVYRACMPDSALVGT